jgi:hypothetical protein
MYTLNIPLTLHMNRRDLGNSSQITPCQVVNVILEELAASIIRV